MNNKRAKLFETAAEYNVTLLRDEELIRLILDTAPEKTASKVQESLQKFLDQRGGLAGILNVEDAEFAMELDEHTAIRVKALLELAKRLGAERTKYPQITSADDVYRLVRDMKYLEHEEMHILILDTKNFVKHRQMLYKGTVNSSVLRIAEIFRPAIVRNAPRIILVHNHPTGDPAPSPEDIAVTKQVAAAGTLLDIDVLDHIIVGNPRYVSLKEKIDF